jgi:hypothetical protein
VFDLCHRWSLQFSSGTRSGDGNWDGTLEEKKKKKSLALENIAFSIKEE